MEFTLHNLYVILVPVPLQSFSGQGTAVDKNVTQPKLRWFQVDVIAINSKGFHQELVDPCEISISQTTTDYFHFT